MSKGYCWLYGGWTHWLNPNILQINTDNEHGDIHEHMLIHTHTHIYIYILTIHFLTQLWEVPLHHQPQRSFWKGSKHINDFKASCAILPHGTDVVQHNCKTAKRLDVLSSMNTTFLLYPYNDGYNTYDALQMNTQIPVIAKLCLLSHAYTAYLGNTLV